MFIKLTRKEDGVPVFVSVNRIRKFRANEDDGALVAVGDANYAKAIESPSEIAALIAAEERRRLRAELAGRAMQGLLAADIDPDDSFAGALNGCENCASLAVEMADALLAELDKPAEKPARTCGECEHWTAPRPGFDGHGRADPGSAQGHCESMCDSRDARESCEHFKARNA